MKTVQKQLNLNIKQTNQNKNKVDMESLRENHKEFIKSNKLTLKSSLRFRSEKHNVFIEEINQVALSANDEKEYNQSVQQKHAYGTSKDLSCTKVEIECNNIIKQYRNNYL